MTADDEARYGVRHRTDSGSAEAVRATISRLTREQVPDTPAGARRAAAIATRLVVERRRLAALEGRA